jgi:hypothetical protein
MIESARALHLGGRAVLLDAGDRECAWAEKWIRHDPDLKWILGNYVEADNANSNGHIFPLEDLKANSETIGHKPLNMLHEPHKIVGHYAAIEMLYPMDSAAKAPAASHRTCKGCGAHMAKDAGKCQSCGKGWEAADADPKPYVEALSAFYRYYFPEEYSAVEKAHREGSLFYSMEAVPKTLTCAAADGCGQEFAYKGRIHESYCAHLHEPVAMRRLNQPHFKGGAIIIPPVSPGWKGADIKELSALIEASGDDAERLYEGFKSEAPHLSPAQWEAAMAALLKLAADA